MSMEVLMEISDSGRGSNAPHTTAQHNIRAEIKQKPQKSSRIFGACVIKKVFFVLFFLLRDVDEAAKKAVCILYMN